MVLYARCRLARACCVLGCALTVEDQGCRNGQMRNSKETVGYMVDIYEDVAGDGTVEGGGTRRRGGRLCILTVHGTALCLGRCRVPLGRHA